VLDPQQLQDKLQKGGISVDTLIARIFRNEPADSKERMHFNGMKDSAGINWGNKFFVFGTQKSNPDKTNASVFSVLCGLKDPAKFEAFIKKQDGHKNDTVRKEKDYSYLITGEGTLMLAWNDEQAIVTMYNHMLKPVYDTVAMTFKRPPHADTEGEMKREVAQYFTQKVSESLADVKIFTDMFKDKADGYVFTSTNASLGALSMLPIQPPKLEEFVKDNFSTATLSFEDGKIIAKSTMYTNKLLGSVLKQYAGPTVDLSMIENYPSQNINGIILAAFNPEIFGGIMKQLEVEGLANTALEKAGLSTQDLYKSLKGTIAVIVSDLGMPDMSPPEPQTKHDEKSMIHKKSIGKMLFNAPVGDKASFFKVMDKAVEHGMLVKHNNVYSAGGIASGMGLFIHADENNLIISSDSVTYTQYMAKTTKAAINPEALARFKGKSTVFYFDIANTLNGFIKDSTGAFGYNNSLRTAKQTFKDVIGTSDNFDGNSIKGVFEVRMQNEKQNSLVTLTSLIADIALDMRLQAKKEKESEEKLFPGGVPAIIRTN
ncbi:MAG: hypothetical protein JWQ30_1217, partial [Sediminibacterium sp.]|nr:hypothetical protein [Sediminibacterium sp.]